MNKKQFDICLVFHLGLIRSRPHDKTIDDARSDIINGASKSLIDALEQRRRDLIAWQDRVFIQDKIDVYNRHNTRNPSQGAFDGAFDVTANGTGIGKAAKDNKVNYQSIKVLIPRLQRWNEFAKRLHETL